MRLCRVTFGARNTLEAGILRLRRLILASSSGEADPPSARVQRVVLNALANQCGFAA
jgi:hypothetical protein